MAGLGRVLMENIKLSTEAMVLSPATLHMAEVLRIFME